MFDPRTKAIKEWPLNLPWVEDLDPAAVDKNGDVWSAGMHTDYVVRLNPTTGKVNQEPDADGERERSKNRRRL